MQWYHNSRHFLGYYQYQPTFMSLSAILERDFVCLSVCHTLVLSQNTLTRNRSRVSSKHKVTTVNFQGGGGFTGRKHQRWRPLLEAQISDWHSFSRGKYFCGNKTFVTPLVNCGGLIANISFWSRPYGAWGATEGEIMQSFTVGKNFVQLPHNTVRVRDTHVTFHHFYCAMRCVSAVFAVMQCLSVRLSVTFVDHVKTNKHIFEIFSPSDSDTSLVFPYRMGCRYSDGNPPNGGVECKGVW